MGIDPGVLCDLLHVKSTTSQENGKVPLGCCVQPHLASQALTMISSPAPPGPEPQVLFPHRAVLTDKAQDGGVTRLL